MAEQKAVLKDANLAARLVAGLVECLVDMMDNKKARMMDSAMVDYLAAYLVA